MTWLAGLVGPVAELARLIHQWISEGVSVSQIQRRLADPDGIAAELLTRAELRRRRREDLM